MVNSPKNFLLFSDYYYSEDEEEFSKDRENILKLLTRRVNQINLKTSDENILKFTNCLIFMRNVFFKEAILDYLISFFRLKLSQDAALIICEIIVSDDRGLIKDVQKFNFLASLLDKKLQNYENPHISRYLNIISR